MCAFAGGQRRPRSSAPSRNLVDWRQVRSLTAATLALLLSGLACSSSTTDTPAAPTAGSDAATADAGADAAAALDSSTTDAAVIEAPPGTCTFGEAGSLHESPAGDLSTFALHDGASVTVQCGSKDATMTYALQLSFSDVTGPGTFTKGLSQYSEQLTNGGSPTSYRSTKAALVITTLTASSVAATIAFEGSSTGGTKTIKASFNVPVRK